MQNKGFVKVFAVLLTLVCVFYLSFSFVTRYHMNQAANAGSFAGRNDFLRQFNVRLGEICAIRELDIAAMQNANQIDHRIVAAHQISQRRFTVDIGFRHLDAGLHDQGLGSLTTPGRHGDFNTALR